MIAGNNPLEFQDEKPEIRKQGKQIRWFLKPYDISRKNYKLTVCSETIKDFSALIKFTGPVSNFIFLGAQTIQTDGYIVVPDLKTTKKFTARDNSYNYY